MTLNTKLRNRPIIPPSFCNLTLQKEGGFFFQRIEAYKKYGDIKMIDWQWQ